MAGRKGIAAFILCAGIATGPAAASERYGGYTLGTGANRMLDDGTFEGTGTNATSEFYTGWANGSAGFVDLTLRLQGTAVSPAQSNNSLVHGYLLGLRAGRQLSPDITAALFAALIEAHTLEGSTIRYALGADIFHTPTPDWTLRLQIGLLDGTGGTDDGGLDGIRGLRHVALSSRHRLGPRWSLALNGAVGLGVLDSDADRGLIRELSLAAFYDFDRPGMEGFIRVTYSRAHQFGEDDFSDESRIDFGVTRRFGDTPRARAMAPAFARYEDWMGTTAGVTE